MFKGSSSGFKGGRVRQGGFWQAVLQYAPAIIGAVGALAGSKKSKSSPQTTEQILTPEQQELQKVQLGRAKENEVFLQLAAQHFLGNQIKPLLDKSQGKTTPAPQPTQPQLPMPDGWDEWMNNQNLSKYAGSPGNIPRHLR